MSAHKPAVGKSIELGVGRVRDPGLPPNASVYCKVSVKNRVRFDGEPVIYAQIEILSDTDDRMYHRVSLDNVNQDDVLELLVYSGTNTKNKLETKVGQCEVPIALCEDTFEDWLSLENSESGAALQLQAKIVDAPPQSAPAIVPEDEFLTSAAIWNKRGISGGYVNEDGIEFSEKECYAQGLQEHPTCLDLWFNLACVGGGEVGGRTYQSAECWSVAVELAPDDWKVWNGLGTCGGGIVHGELVSPPQCFEKALEEEKNASQAWVNLGHVEGGTVREVRFDAQACYAQAVAINERNWQAWNCLGSHGGGNGVYPRGCFEKALSLNPESADCWYNLGTVDGGTVDSCPYNKVSCFVRAVELEPTKDVAWNNLGASISIDVFVGGQMHGKRDCFVKALEANEFNGTAWLNLGDNGGGTIDGKKYSPRSAFEKAATCCPALAHAWYKLGLHDGGTVADQEFNEKICFIKALENDQDFAPAWNGLGLLGGGEFDGKFRKPRECFEYAVTMNPDCAASWFNLGSVRGGKVENKRYIEEECFAKACERDPRDADVWNALGAAGGGDVADDAIWPADCFQKALELQESPQAWRNLGAVGGGIVSGRSLTPAECFEKGLALNPEDEVMQAHLAAVGGGTVGDKRIDSKTGWRNVLEQTLEDHVAWNNLGIFGGGAVRGEEYTREECYRNALDNVRFAAAKMKGTTTQASQMSMATETTFMMYGNEESVSKSTPRSNRSGSKRDCPVVVRKNSNRLEATQPSPKYSPSRFADHTQSIPLKIPDVSEEITGKSEVAVAASDCQPSPRSQSQLSPHSQKSHASASIPTKDSFEYQATATDRSSTKSLAGPDKVSTNEAAVVRESSKALVRESSTEATRSKSGNPSKEGSGSNTHGTSVSQRLVKEHSSTTGLKETSSVQSAETEPRPHASGKISATSLKSQNTKSMGQTTLKAYEKTSSGVSCPDVDKNATAKSPSNGAERTGIDKQGVEKALLKATSANSCLKGTEPNADANVEFDKKITGTASSKASAKSSTNGAERSVINKKGTENSSSKAATAKSVAASARSQHAAIETKVTEKSKKSGVVNPGLNANTNKSFSTSYSDFIDPTNRTLQASIYALSGYEHEPTSWTSPELFVAIGVQGRDDRWRTKTVDPAKPIWNEITQIKNLEADNVLVIDVICRVRGFFSSEETVIGSCIIPVSAQRMDLNGEIAVNETGQELRLKIQEVST